jgi:hypothetical protein
MADNENPMKTCKNCYAQVDDRAKVCPYCRNQKYTPPWVKAVYVLVSLAVMGVGIAIYLSASGSGSGY